MGQVRRQVKFELEPKQVWFMQSQADELLYSGAYGAGKTLMVCLKAYVRAQHPKAVEVLARDTMKNVKETILPTLFEGNGKTPAVLQPGCYIWHKSDEAVRLLGPGNQPRGLIRYRGLGATNRNRLDKMGFRGPNITGIGIDQMEEITQKQYNNVGGRLRVADEGLTRQLYGSCNPDAPSHHLAERFGIKSSHDPETTARIDSKIVNQDGSVLKLTAILTSPDDNPHLTPDYLARLENLKGVEYLRYRKGRWISAEGVVYDNFDRAIHAVSRKGPFARVFVTIDDGTSKPAALLLLRLDGDGRRHYGPEVHRPGMLNAEKVQHVLNWQRQHGVLEAVVVDPAAAALKLDLRAAGLPVIDGKNDVLPGIAVVRQGLALGPDGKPGWTIEPTCERTLKELESYMWDQNNRGDKVVKADDHGPDAIRYGEMHLYDPPALVFDAGGLAAVEACANREPAPVVGTLTHDDPIGHNQDLAIADRKVARISFEAQKDGPLKLWCEMKRGRPLLADPHLMFVAAGDGQGGTPGVIVVADTVRRTIAAQWVKSAAPERLARMAAMLSLWFGDEDNPAPVGYLAGAMSSPGSVFGQHLSRLGGVGQPWEPDQHEFAEAVGLLRAAWEGGQLIERDAAVFSVARQYIYANAAMMHASLVGNPQRKGSHADTLMARAGLWRMLAGIAPKDLPEREAPPGSAEYRKRRREAVEKRERELHFG